MNLLQVRTQFVKLSGRYDLVVDTSAWADNGANFYIQAGQRFLDKRVTVPESIAKLYLPLAIGEYKVTFQHHCRSIQSVFCETATDRWKLEKVTLEELKEFYYEPAGSVTNGPPSYFALAELRALETTSKDSLATYIDNTHAESDTKYDYRGLVIGPPADEACVVTVSGLFSQNVLSSNTDENWWSLEMPELLVKAALYQLEVFSRGTENARNWLDSIELELFGLEKDAVEEEISDIDVMEG
jgi:hypothetical protein